jgi:hypothetical protein
VRRGASYASRASAEREKRRRQKEVLEQLKSEQRIIPPEMGFRAWCESLAEQGLKIDGKPFSLKDRPALIPLYDAIPSTPEEATDKILVVQKAAQLGLTVWEILANIYWALKWEPVTIGSFMPDQPTALYKSQHRFMRIVRSSPLLRDRLIYRADYEGRTERIGEGNVLTRVMGESLFLFLWSSGKVTTESRPMDVVTLDEVQEMTLEQIDKIQMRTGDSMIRLMLLLSTANMPDLDINFWYLMGTQEVWKSRCVACGALSDLSDPAGVFPARSIALHAPAAPVPGAPDSMLGEHVWTCPECGHWIADPQHGELVTTFPGRKIRSFLLPRTISPRITASKAFEAWARAKSGDQKKTFYNRTLARPYIDADQLPVTLAHCQACADEGMRIGLTWQTQAIDTYMGIDQMGGFNAVIIKRRLPDGRQAVVHAEAVFAADPFARCSELMRQYGVTLCVVEQLPNVNDARRFAQEHRGRVFLAGYADLRDDMLHWGDDISRSDRKTIEEARTRYTVTLNQYKAMQSSLFRVRDRACLFPNPDQLEQDVLDGGVWRRVPLIREWVFPHLTKTALVVDEDESTRKPRPKVVKVGIDPHFSFANMLCDVAYSRAHGTSTILLPDVAPPTEKLMQDGINAGMPGLPPQVVMWLQEQRTGTCGKCSAMDPQTHLCGARDLMVRATDPACDLYLER